MRSAKPPAIGPAQRGFHVSSPTQEPSQYWRDSARGSLHVRLPDQTLESRL
jgi:hypothetical protein